MPTGKYSVSINDVTMQINRKDRQDGFLGPERILPFTYYQGTGGFTAPTLAPGNSWSGQEIPSFSSKTLSPFSSGTPVSFPEVPPPRIKESWCNFGADFPLFPGLQNRINPRCGTRGDAKTHVWQGRYERVYSFGHHEPQVAGQAGDFLEIQTQSGAALQISRNHLIFVVRKTKTTNPLLVAVPALLIQVGDELTGERRFHRSDEKSSSCSQPQIVTSIQPVKVTDGLYAPFTASGQFLIVSGNEIREEGSILVSSYIGFSDSHEMTVGGGLSVSFQWLAHSFEFPHGTLCRYFWKPCEEETYDTRGLSLWVAKPFNHASCLVNRHEGVLKTFA